MELALSQNFDHAKSKLGHPDVLRVPAKSRGFGTNYRHSPRDCLGAIQQTTEHGNWASAFIWGRNHTSSPGEIHNLNGYTFESTVNFLDKNYLYTRLELVDKNELLRASDRALLGSTDDHPSFRIGAYTFGGARDVWNTEKVSLAIGSDLTFYSKPAILDRLYGSNPVSWKLFFRIRPGKMDMSMGGMHGTHGTTDSGGENGPTKP